MSVNGKKEALLKLANELRDELAEDEKLFLACSFKDDKEQITMCCDLFYLARALCAVCYDENMSGHDFMKFMDLVKRVYIHKNFR